MIVWKNMSREFPSGDVTWHGGTLTEIPRYVVANYIGDTTEEYRNIYYAVLVSDQTKVQVDSPEAGKQWCEMHYATGA